jgi:hypothetical protein
MAILDHHADHYCNSFSAVRHLSRHFAAAGSAEMTPADGREPTAPVGRMSQWFITGAIQRSTAALDGETAAGMKSVAPSVAGLRSFRRS